MSRKPCRGSSRGTGSTARSTSSPRRLSRGSWRWARRAGVVLDGWNLAAVAAGGALASQAAQHMTCPVAHADTHLLVFHLGGVMLAAALGSLGAVRMPKLSLSR